MSPKNLNASKKTHNFLFNKLKDKRTLQIYKKFESELAINSNFIVAVSGGPDSLALSFLAKIYSIKKSLDVKYFIVDHRLRKNSTLEAKYVKKKLKNFSINLNILNWKGIKPKKNIQSIGREKRYKLLTDVAKKFRIKNILLGHHLDDLFENFFIRILRGSGLKGLVSLDKETHKNEVNLIRPLIKIDKNDLIYVSNYIFGSYIKDPSNEDDKFKRVKIRNFLKQLSLEGLDRKKFFLTIKNLKLANENIEFYTKKNLEDNVSVLSKKNIVILKENFFSQSSEVVFRSLTEVIKIVGKKYYAVRGKKIDNIIDLVNTKSSFKVTLGSCIIKKVKETVILSKE
ncbi:tRNA lysidine(34) synthetase TilS [Candidatus Pelagibacter sp.]|nr:tRNA lysidine(34) synthetase TilS [Candidatus Pelagibacter sp.]MDB3987234.1 tRNA lysidine(34) synthetase TilS [Candidatus Pelagibacter sp.]